jgi:phosphate transport system permease protein
MTNALADSTASSASIADSSGLVDITRDAPVDDTPRVLGQRRTTPDKLYRLLTTSAAFGSLIILVLIGLFLVLQSIPAFRLAGIKFFTVADWRPDDDPATFGIVSMLVGTVIASFLALIIAVPVSVGTAVFVNEFLPPKIQRAFVTVLDLLAAIPSLIFGLWGLFFLQPHLSGVSKWLSDWLGFIPLFKTNGIYTSSMFICGIVLALMIVPIVASVSRAVIAEVPRSLCEAAFALGGTRTGMVRQVVLPYSRGGIVGASMLGLGRALGETIAIALILSFDFTVSSHILQPGGATVAGTIALRFPEALDMGRSALSAAGLTLFVLTLLVNMAARSIVARTNRRRGGGPESRRAGK